MAFEERLALLCDRAQKDYDEYMGHIYRLHGEGVTKEAMKIVVMGEMLSQIKDGYFDHPYDVELLLYHDHPLLAAYGQWEQEGPGIKMAVNESVNGLLVKTRNQVAEMQGQYDTLPPDEQARAMEYHNRHLAVFDYLQDAEIRGKKLSELMETIDRDYEEWQECIKIYTENGCEYPAQSKDTLQAVYDYMKTYDSYTVNELDSLNRLTEPLTSIFSVYDNLTRNNLDDEKLNVKSMEDAIAIVARAEQENVTEKTQGRDDDGLEQ